VQNILQKKLVANSCKQLFITKCFLITNFKKKMYRFSSGVSTSKITHNNIYWKSFKKGYIWNWTFPQTKISRSIPA